MSSSQPTAPIALVQQLRQYLALPASNLSSHLATAEVTGLPRRFPPAKISDNPATTRPVQSSAPVAEALLDHTAGP